MFDVHGLNVAIELWGAGFCVLGIASVLILLRTSRQLRSLLLGIFASELVMCAGDAAAGIYRGSAGQIAWAMTHAGNLLTFVAGFAAVALVTWFVRSRVVEADEPALWRWATGVSIAAALMCLLACLGAFYTIDDANLYHRSDWYWVSQAFSLAVNAVNAAIVVRRRAKLSKAALFALLFVTLAPAASSAAQAFLYGLNLNVVAVVFATVILFLEMQASSSRMLQQKAEELAAAQIEASESRVAVMVSQIQPHFLFNTLDTIYGLVDEDRELAKRAIASFSRYLRANLDSLGRTAPVPIEKEMEHAKTYLELERMSDEKRLSYEIDMQATGFSVPVLSVQTLVENAAKHGTGKRIEGGRVSVRTRELEDEYTVTIADDGVGFDPKLLDSAEGIGISNTRERLAAMCGGALEIVSAPGAGTTAVMHIPKKKEAS